MPFKRVSDYKSFLRKVISKPIHSEVKFTPQKLAYTLNAKLHKNQWSTFEDKAYDSNGQTDTPICAYLYFFFCKERTKL
jgi:hypothetical protein